MKQPDGFTIRVYGVYLSEDGKLLLTDEFRLGQRMTKFPGGGLKLGEGPEDCLKRECREEMGVEIRIHSHLYTTGFYQPTFLLPHPKQLISIYYRMDLDQPFGFDLVAKPFDYGMEEDGAQCFRLKSLQEITREELSFPIDRHVLNMLKLADSK